jgi:hypothetical protein
MIRPTAGLVWGPLVLLHMAQLLRKIPSPFPAPVPYGYFTINFERVCCFGGGVSSLIYLLMKSWLK